MRILIWHVHGSWTNAFVQGEHTYLLPVLPDRGPDGRGRAQTWTWPAGAVELAPDELADTPVDVVVVQRPRDLELAERWLGGRRPGRDLPVVWLEHNAPQGAVNGMRHPVADLDGDVTLVHVTHTNRLFWDSGDARATVIEHGVVDPGPRWTGAEPSAAVVVNEPVRRARVVGCDLLPAFGAVAPVDVFGMDTDRLHGLYPGPWLRCHGDVPQERLHDMLAARRCYVHPFRWTSFGLSLVEAMHLGMPVVALATTAVPDSVPPCCGVVANDVTRLVAAVERLLRDDEAAAAMGQAARAHALDRFGLERFLSDWNILLEAL